MSAEVFVSYSSQDHAQVSKIIERLRKAGVSVWMDEGGIDAATLWSEAIVEAINESKILIMMVSKHSTDSANVVKEVMIASESSKTILPVYLEPADIPTRLKYQLTGIQHSEAYSLTPDELLDELLRGLAKNGVTVPGYETTKTTASSQSPSHKKRRGRQIQWKLPALISLLLGILIGWLSTRLVENSAPAKSTAPILNTVIKLPVEAPLTDSTLMPLGSGRSNIAISNDGTFVVYTAKTGTDSALYKRLLDQDKAMLIDGTEGAFAPFISPDGQWAGFFANNKLMKVSMNGGTPQVLTDAVNAYGGSWSETGRIIFSEKEGNSIFSVDEKGTNRTLIAKTDSAFPNVLPGGRHIMVTSRDNAQSRYSIDLIDTETGDAKQLIFDAGTPQYLSSGHVVFCRKSDLYAVEFNPFTLELGEERQVQESVRTEDKFASQFAVARDTGTLVYLAGNFGGLGELTWIDRHGTATPLDFTHKFFATFDLSPDGSRLLIQVWDPNSSVWLYDLKSKLETKIESSGSDGFKGWPRWHPHRESFTFGSRKENIHDLYSRSLESSTASKLIQGEPDIDIIEGIWTSDGRKCVYFKNTKETSGDLWIYDKETKEHSKLIATEKPEWGPRISPDDKWVAFTREKDGGEYEIYVIPITGGTAEQVSLNGGEEPIWSPDGRELIYRNGTQWTGRPVKASNVLAWGDPYVIFEGNYINAPGHSYDISPDGKRFLVVKEVHEQGDSLELNIITNWSSKFAQ